MATACARRFPRPLPAFPCPRRNLDHMAERFKLYAVDWLGTGLSGGPLALPANPGALCSPPCSTSPPCTSAMPATHPTAPQPHSRPLTRRPPHLAAHPQAARPTAPPAARRARRSSSHAWTSGARRWGCSHLCWWATRWEATWPRATRCSTRSRWAGCAGAGSGVRRCAGGAAAWQSACRWVQLRRRGASIDQWWCCQLLGMQQLQGPLTAHCPLRCCR